MPQPNGYRKALRFMKHADHFGFPIITFVDTPGAYAGKNAEELGQVSLLCSTTLAGYTDACIVNTIIETGRAGYQGLARACLVCTLTPIL